MLAIIFGLSMDYEVSSACCWFRSSGELKGVHDDLESLRVIA